MNLKDIASTVYYILAIFSVGCVVVKLFYGWLRGDQIHKKFVTEMASCHLPYIYRELRTINPVAPDHPPISFVQFKDK